jgi:8-oxo-dGTP diphosphatase
VAAVVEREGRYLITQRREQAVLSLLWEFPGGKVEPGESDEAALQREMHERLCADVAVGQLISYVRHPYDHYTVDLYLYECRLRGAGTEGPLPTFACQAVHAYEWVTSEDFDRYPFTPADEASMSKLLGVTET